MALSTKQGTFFGTSGTTKVSGHLANINNMKGQRGLTKSDRALLASGGDRVYIYNVSPIFQHVKPMQSYGKVTIPKRAENARYSAPFTVEPHLVRQYDGGDRLIKNMISEGIEVAEDIVGNSKDYPQEPYNNLENYGVFMTVGSPIEELPKDKQEKILLAAENKHLDMCRQKVYQADQLHSAGKTAYIPEMPRLCALFLGEEEDHPWVARSSKPKRETVECPFCSFAGKPGTPLCSNCKQVIDQEKFDSLQTKIKGTKKQVQS